MKSILIETLVFIRNILYVNPLIITIIKNLHNNNILYYYHHHYSILKYPTFPKLNLTFFSLFRNQR